MQFLAPLFWLASIALAVPIVLHLTRKEVKRPTLFSSLMFLRRIPVQEVRRRRIRELPLLLLRCLALLLLVAAFAQPVIQSAWLDSMSTPDGRSVLILIDNSMSSSSESNWGRAITAANDLVDGLSERDQAAIVRFGDTAEMVSNWEGRQSVLRVAVAKGLEPGFGGTSYQEGLRLALRVLDEASNPEKELVLISDLQANGLDLSSGERLAIPEEVSLKILDVGASDTNLYVGDLLLNRDAFGPDYPFSLQVNVVSSPPLQGEQEVSLFLDGEMIDRRVCLLQEDGRCAVQFEGFALPPGISKGRVVIDGNDAFPADDVSYFVLERREPFVVHLVQKQRNAPPYFEEALASGLNLPFQLKTSSVIPPLSVSESPVLVVDNMPLDRRADRLRDYLEQGGGIILCPGRDIAAGDFNRVLESIVPLSLGSREFAHSRDLPFVSINEANWEHPVFSPFARNGGAALSEVRFFGYWSIVNISTARVLARFTTGHPALVESAVGEGRLFLFAGSLGRVWTDFPLKNSYLPFWQRLVEYAADWQRRPAMSSVNDLLPRPQDALGSGQDEGRWEVLDPNGQRLFSLSEATPEYVELKLPGYYEIRRDRKSDWVAVNTHRLESEVGRMPEQELMAALESLRTVREEVGPAQNRPEAVTPEHSLWLFLLLAVVGVLMAEAWLANQFAGRKRAQV